MKDGSFEDEEITPDQYREANSEYGFLCLLLDGIVGKSITMTMHEFITMPNTLYEALKIYKNELMKRKVDG
jgi:hypothetical protein